MLQSQYGITHYHICLFLCKFDLLHCDFGISRCESGMLHGEFGTVALTEGIENVSPGGSVEGKNVRCGPVALAKICALESAPKEK